MDFNTKFLAAQILEILVFGMMCMLVIYFMNARRIADEGVLTTNQLLKVSYLVGLPFGLLLEAGRVVLGSTGEHVWNIVMIVAALITGRMVLDHMAKRAQSSPSTPAAASLPPQGQSVPGKKRRMKKRERRR